MARWSVGLLCAVLVAVPAAAETDPFEGLAGTWSGTGVVKMTGGGREQGKCHATWERPSPLRVTVELTCAGPRYKVVVSGHLEYRDGLITGRWREETRDVEGTISGRVEGGRLLLTTSGVITATLTIETKGDQQTFLIQLQGAKFESAAGTMTRNVSTSKPK